MARLARQLDTRCSALRQGLDQRRQVAIHPRARYQSVSRSSSTPAVKLTRNVDVANYNALSAASPDPITQGDPNYDELHYINVSTQRPSLHI